MNHLTPHLELMVEKEASDLFLTANSPVKIKVEGELISVGKTILTPAATNKIAHSVMDKKHEAIFKKTLECDFAIALKDSDRFRVNVFRQRGHVSMVLRRIQSKIPTIEELGFPEILSEMSLLKRGLILMVGATGSGKSTTLAAMVNHRNQNSSGHILTIEDPIEFSHQNLKSIVNQREIGVDTKSYANALKASLREAPDVILVGEIRVRETMEAALELSNTGHLALSTLHANNAGQAIERVINMFPQSMHKQLLMDLSLNVRGIISQRLVKAKDGKRCAALEILVMTPHIQDLVLKGEIEEIKIAMEESGKKGMQTFDTALHNLYKEGRIELEEALNYASSRTNLEAKINFG
ncbi:MAG: PilT/PilU family type 4a pilus ATPase [Gammaproteobacteria bacterium]|nr:PilT/PilU family type 4a pilus ATPase [Gammaproteobacteria bacterium]